MKRNEALNIEDSTGLDASMFESEDASTNEEGTAEGMRSAVERVEIKNKKKNGLPYGVKEEEHTEANGRDKRITPKMRAFASYIVQGMSARQAYRKAYDCENMQEASVQANANRLLKDARITLLLDSFWEDMKENIIADAIATRRHVMKELVKHANDDKANLNNRLKALEMMGRAVGMFTDRVESKVEEVSADKLKQELESHLHLLDQVTPELKRKTH